MNEWKRTRQTACTWHNDSRLRGTPNACDVAKNSLKVDARFRYIEIFKKSIYVVLKKLIISKLDYILFIKLHLRVYNLYSELL